MEELCNRDNGETNQGLSLPTILTDYLDILPLLSLVNLTKEGITLNPLRATSLNVYIPWLKERG
ncbi:hypothetical protein ACFLWO_01065 [Chloroflexota bacterium]